MFLSQVKTNPCAPNFKAVFMFSLNAANEECFVGIIIVMKQVSDKGKTFAFPSNLTNRGLALCSRLLHAVQK